MLGGGRNDNSITRDIVSFDPLDEITIVICRVISGWRIARGNLAEGFQFGLVPTLLIPNRVAKHLQKYALEQIVELLQVLFALGDQPFHFSEQMGNADLVIERGKRDFEVFDGWFSQLFKCRTVPSGLKATDISL